MDNLPVPLPWLVSAAVALLVLATLWRMTIRPALRRGMPFAKRPSLLTAAEMRFYRVLLIALPPAMTVCVKVRLMDVLSVPEGAWQKYGAQGSGMHCDFVLADAATLEPRLVLELDDRSHWRADAQQRDAFKNTAFAAAALPVLRVTAAARYDAGELRSRIGAALAVK